MWVVVVLYCIGLFAPLPFRWGRLFCWGVSVCHGFTLSVLERDFCCCLRSSISLPRHTLHSQEEEEDDEDEDAWLGDEALLVLDGWVTLRVPREAALQLQVRACGCLCM